MGSVVDMDKEYARRMRKAKYQAFWIRVRIWIEWNGGNIVLISGAIGFLILWGVYKIL